MNAVKFFARVTSATPRSWFVWPLIAALCVFAVPVAIAQDSEKAAPAVEEPTETPAESGPTVSRMVICEGIEDREPVGKGTVFPSDVGALCCFTEIDRAEPPLQIFHRWYIGERLINEIPINVGAAHWRCWSRKTIFTRWKGECHVEVVTEEGDIVRVEAFTLE